MKEFNVCFVEMHKDVDRGCRSREYARATCCDHPRSHSLKTSFLRRLVIFSCLPSVKARRENKAADLHFKFFVVDDGPRHGNYNYIRKAIDGDDLRKQDTASAVERDRSTRPEEPLSSIH